MAKGIVPGLRLADARAILPGLAPATPEADRRFLLGLATACLRYTPMVALDGPGEDDATALLLDITGSAHLFGGEVGLLADLGRRLDRRGRGHRLSIADTQALAWAWARYGEGGVLAIWNFAPVTLQLPPHVIVQNEELYYSLAALSRKVSARLRNPRRKGGTKRDGHDGNPAADAVPAI